MKDAAKADKFRRSCTPWGWLIGITSVVLLRVGFGLNFPDWPIPYFLATFATWIGVAYCLSDSHRPLTIVDYLAVVMSAFGCITFGMIIAESVLGFPTIHHRF